MYFPEPFFLKNSWKALSVSCIHISTWTDIIISLSQVAQEWKLKNMASTSHFGNIVQIKVLKSIQKDFSGYIYTVYIYKKTNAVFFFLVSFSGFLCWLFCLSLLFSYLISQYLETKIAGFRSWADLASTSCSFVKQQKTKKKQKTKQQL